MTERLAMAARHGIEPVNTAEVDDVRAYLADQTGGLGPHSVIDAVGMESHGDKMASAGQKSPGKMAGKMAESAAKKFGVDRLSTMTDAIYSVHRGGTVHPLPLGEAPHGYDIFQRKADGCVKIMLQPGH